MRFLRRDPSFGQPRRSLLFSLALPVFLADMGPKCGNDDDPPVTRDPDASDSGGDSGTESGIDSSPTTSAVEIIPG